MVRRRCLFLCLAGVALVCTPLWAHHAFEAEYDRNQPVTMSGTVTLMEWMNPHIYFFIDVEDDSGNVTNWAVEGGAPNGLYRRGWRRDSLQARGRSDRRRLARPGRFQLDEFQHCLEVIGQFTPLRRDLQPRSGQLTLLPWGGAH